MPTLWSDSPAPVATPAHQFARSWFAWGMVLLTSLVIVAHGCHGPDEDHEPTAFPARPHLIDEE